MQDGQQVSNHEVAVPTTIELHPSLDRVLDPNDPLHTLFSEKLMQELTGVLQTLGIPGKPLIQIISSQDLATRNRLLRISVHKHVCHYPDELLQRVHGYVNGSQLNPQAQPTLILAWLHNLMQEQPEGAEVASKDLVEFPQSCLS